MQSSDRFLDHSNTTAFHTLHTRVSTQSFHHQQDRFYEIQNLELQMKTYYIRGQLSILAAKIPA
jgi:hypothetical protein